MGTLPSKEPPEIHLRSIGRRLFNRLKFGSTFERRNESLGLQHAFQHNSGTAGAISTKLGTHIKEARRRRIVALDGPIIALLIIYTQQEATP
jgi:hypothetical protein